jgi:hypothetical protein
MKPRKTYPFKVGIVIEKPATGTKQFILDQKTAERQSRGGSFGRQNLWILFFRPTTVLMVIDWGNVNFNHATVK